MGLGARNGDFNGKVHAYVILTRVGSTIVNNSVGVHPIAIGSSEFHFGVMERALTYVPLPSDPEANPNLNIVIAYEDFETGKQAKKTCDFLAQNLSDHCQVSNQMWKFDVLGIPKLREMAATDAAQADVVIKIGRASC